MDYTDSKIRELIKIPKKVVKPPAKNSKSQWMYEQYNLNVASENNKLYFYVYTRQSTEFKEDFSIGLVYLPQDSERIRILRYNGLHGEHTNPDNTKIINKCHFHIATENCIKLGIKPDKQAEIASEYSTFEEALKVFWKDINILDDIKEYFPMYYNLQLDFWGKL